ncbi:CYFA0S01e01849g1_1 [Cyberlindnera fabianii]|uniref:CYFA0S01e01849g1_1 n=1 Tax=Cyberlindnera fabianii TaxID=36022 RepID=A0A061AG39_CYBFA|nr:CYFA0S01e01849g1_1 [Cyberlindnera fabianii]
MLSQRRAAGREESVALYHTQLVYNTCLGCPKGQSFFRVSVCMEVGVEKSWRVIPGCRTLLPPGKDYGDGRRSAT